VAQASLRGWEYAFAHPEEALDVVQTRQREAHLPTNRAHQRFMLARMRDVILGQAADHVPPLGVLSRADFDRVAETLTRQGLLHARPSFADFYKGAQK